MTNLYEAVRTLQKIDKKLENLNNILCCIALSQAVLLPNSQANLKAYIETLLKGYLKKND